MTTNTDYVDPARKVFTSYFSKCVMHPRACSIALITPAFAPKGMATFKALAPSYEMIKMPIEEYHPRYMAILRNLDPQRVLTAVRGRILLCYEGPEKWCHRHMVAKWLWDETGEQVLEWSSEQPVLVAPGTWWNPRTPSVTVAAPTTPATPSNAARTRQMDLI